MQRFKNILLVCDHEATNEAALDRAVTLTRKNKAQLTVIKTVDLWPGKADVHESGVQAGRELLEKLIAPVQYSEIRVQTKVLSGTAYLEIVREVLAEKRDLVIMTAEDEKGLKAKLFCSTSLHVMRKCPCPVWVMKPAQGKRFARILAAVDTGVTDLHREHHALNSKIMDLATSLAEQEQSELHIVHAWEMFGESVWRGELAHMRKEQVDAWALQERQRHERHLSRLLQEYELENVNHHVHLVKGDAQYVIPKLADGQEIDLIVMGTICRTGIPGLLIGNTAESVLQQVNCSVLTVKPDGFVSPVAGDDRLMLSGAGTGHVAAHRGD